MSVQSAWTGWVTATTSADELSLSAVQTEAVRLTWTENTGPYDIRRDETDLIAENLSETEFIDIDVEVGTTYTYEVRSNEGPWSTPVPVTVIAGLGGVFFLRPDGEGGWTA